jgi:type IV pilus assembly protein PilB
MMNDKLLEMVVAEASLDDFRNECRKHGMRSLRESGLRAIHAGFTSIEEVIRETVIDET